MSPPVNPSHSSPRGIDEFRRKPKGGLHKMPGKSLSWQRKEWVDRRVKRRTPLMTQGMGVKGKVRRTTMLLTGKEEETKWEQLRICRSDWQGIHKSGYTEHSKVSFFVYWTFWQLNSPIVSSLLTVSEANEMSSLLSKVMTYELLNKKIPPVS